MVTEAETMTTVCLIQKVKKGSQCLGGLSVGGECQNLDFK